MSRAFIDSSALFSACYSSTGASREFVRRATEGEHELVVSDLALEETRANLTAKAHDRLPYLDLLLQARLPEVVNPRLEMVEEAARYTVAEDAPIVAAALAAKIRYLVSLDRRHLVGNDVVQQGSGLRIVLPETFLAENPPR